MTNQINHQDVAGVVIQTGDRITIGSSSGSTLYVGTVVNQTPKYVWFSYTLPNGTWIGKRWPKRVAVIK